MAKQQIKSATQLNGPVVAANSGKSFQIGELLINCGYTQVATTGTVVTFAVPFTEVYSVVCTTADINNQTGWVSGSNTTAATLNQVYATTPLWVSWIAIGRK